MCQTVIGVPTTAAQHSLSSSDTVFGAVFSGDVVDFPSGPGVTSALLCSSKLSDLVLYLVPASCAAKPLALLLGVDKRSAANGFCCRFWSRTGVARLAFSAHGPFWLSALPFSLIQLHGGRVPLLPHQSSTGRVRTA